jgi:hypothetical protein
MTTTTIADRRENAVVVFAAVVASANERRAYDRLVESDTADELEQLGLDRPQSAVDWHTLAYEAGVAGNPAEMSCVDRCHAILVWARRQRSVARISQRATEQADPLWTIEQFCVACELGKKSFQNMKSERPLPPMQGNALPLSAWCAWVAKWPRVAKRIGG